MKKVLLSTLVFLLLGVAPTAQAQVPLTLSYQGVLSDTDGNAVPDGAYTLAFALYTADAGGEALWSEQQTVSVDKGLFQVVLGSIAPLTVPFDVPYWMGITVDQGDEMAPRTALTASPYSLSARAMVSEGAPGTSFTVRDGEGTPVHVLSAEGDVLHTGVGTFEGGLVAGDTTEAAGKQGTLPNIGVVGAGISIGVRGKATGGFGVGVEGTGSFTGVRGTSDVVGVLGLSNKGVGVGGSSQTEPGVAGMSQTGPGVQGNSTGGNGVHGVSMNGVGVFGSSQNGIAGQFAGDVEITRKLKLGQADEDQAATRFLVWSTDNFVKWRSLPPGSGGDSGWTIGQNNTVSTNRTVSVNDSTGTPVTVLDDEGVKVVDANGTTLAGFGRHNLETGQRMGVYAKAESEGDLAGVFEGDVEVYGELYVEGTSRHTGLEVFEGGLEIPLSNGNTARISPSEGWSIKDGQGTFLAHNDPSGNAFFAGTLQAGTKNFKIDHPLDPSGKYLQHVSVESPDMMTLYNGNAATDDRGYATVVLPPYFEALNCDFRYQLTVIGQFADAIIAEEIEDRRFVIRTNKPNVRVSWQVTGVRHDPFAERYRVPVEVEKPSEERGTYLHPELYGSSSARPAQPSVRPGKR